MNIYWNILTMHVPINVKSSNNISEWQMGFNSAFKGLNSFNVKEREERRSIKVLTQMEMENESRNETSL
jgi:hypothetical protein